MSNKTAAALAAGALLLGLITGKALANDNGDKPAAPVAANRDQLVITEHTKEGAVNAATSYPDALDQALLVVDEAKTRDIVEAISGEAMRGELLERLQDARKAFGDDVQAGGVLGRGAPLGYRIKSYSEHAARIEVWFVGMATSPGSGSPSGEFGTYSVDLTWERDAWRLAGEPDRQAGPAPVIKTTASSAEVLHAQIKDFKEFNHVAP